MKKIYLLIFSLQILALEAIAQVASSPVPAPALNPQLPIQGVGGAAPGQWLLDLIAKFPKLATLVFVVGGLRLTLKPLFSFLHTFFQSWGLVSWDNQLSNVEISKAMKVVYFILDYLGSVKVGVNNSNLPPQ